MTIQLGFDQESAGLSDSTGGTTVTLGEVMPLKYGKALRESDRNSDGSIPVYGSSGVIGYHDEALIPGPSLIVGRKGSVGSVYFEPGPSWPIDTAYYIRDDDETFLKYSKYLLQSLKLGRLDRSTAIPGLSRPDFEAISVTIAPSDKQREIVAEIETQFARLDAAVAALERARTRLKRYRAAVLKAACEGRLVPTEAELARQEGRSYETATELLARIKEAHQSSGRRSRWTTSVGSNDQVDLPEGWAWSTWNDICDRVTVGYVGPMKDEYTDSGVPFLRSQNVRPDRYEPNGLLHISDRFHEKIGKSSLEPGDLVSVRSGSVGTSCVIPESLPIANCSDLVIIKKPHINPKFGSYFMNSLARAIVRKGQVGVALVHFNTQSVAEMSIPVPPLAEQSRIVDEVERRMSVLDRMEAEVTANLKRAEMLRQSVLRTGFSIG